MNAYRHKIQYYETDKMGVTHHSNYVRWFEEARVDFLEQVGYGYDKMEEEGVMSPVLAVRAEYKRMTRFPETVTIVCKVLRFSGVRFTIGYEVTDGEGKLCCRGETDHCFTDARGGLLRLRDSHPDLNKLMLALAEE